MTASMKRFALFVLVTVGLSIGSHAVIKRDPLEILKQSQEAFERRDFPKAVELLTQAIEANPSLTPAYVLRGLANAGQNKADAALADYDKAIELAPDDERPRLLRAAVFQAKREFDKAITDLNFVIQKNPNDPELFASRGICYAQKGDDD